MNASECEIGELKSGEMSNGKGRTSFIPFTFDH